MVHVWGDDPDVRQSLAMDGVKVCMENLKSHQLSQEWTCPQCGGGLESGVLLLDFYPSRRRRGFDFLSDAWRATHFSSRAVVSSSAAIGHSSIILPNALVGEGATLGVACKVGFGAQIHHDAVLEDFVTVAPGAIVLGGAKVEEGSILGAGSILRQNRVIGSGSYVGLGSAVVSDIPNGVIAYGNPARCMHPFAPD